MSKLLGKVALVTGDSKGIGAGIARSLAAEGAVVAVNYASSKEGADRLVDEISKGNGRAIAVHGDVAKLDDIERMFAQTHRALGQLDILVNNAGNLSVCTAGRDNRGAFSSAFQHQCPGPHPGHPGGSKILWSAWRQRDQHRFDRFPPDAAEQLCLHRDQRSRRRSNRRPGEGARSRNVRVNSINPGFVETEGTHAGGFVGSDFVQGLIAQTPLGRGGQPDDIGPIAAFLASDESRWLTGECLLASGGQR